MRNDGNTPGDFPTLGEREGETELILYGRLFLLGFMSRLGKCNSLALSMWPWRKRASDKAPWLRGAYPADWQSAEVGCPSKVHMFSSGTLRPLHVSFTTGKKRYINSETITKVAERGKKG